MAWLVDFFKSLWEMVSGLFDFLVSAVMGLLSIVQQLPELLNTITGFASGLPNVLATFVFATITISVIFLLIGRGQGGN